MELQKSDKLVAVETGTLAIGSACVAFPRVMVRFGGADPDVGLNTPATRALGFWTTAYGALLQYAETEAERERLLTAGAAVASAYCVNTLVAAARKRTSWRGALTNVALVGTITGLACSYLTD